MAEGFTNQALSEGIFSLHDQESNTNHRFVLNGHVYKIVDLFELEVLGSNFEVLVGPP